MDAVDRFHHSFAPHPQTMNQIFMTVHAVGLKDLRILFLDHDGFVEILKREARGMVVAVLGFGHILGEKLVRQMAVHAGGHVVMPGFLLKKNRTSLSEFLMFFSKRCNHGIRAVLYLAAHASEGGYLSIRAIAKELDLPFHFLTKILQDLGDAGIVESIRGKSGGVRLAVPAKDLDVLRVVDVLEGEAFLRGCVLGFEECSSKNPCALHDRWKEMRKDLMDMFSAENLERVATRDGMRL